MEKWKSSTDARYEVSSFGRVRHVVKKKIRKQFTARNGYNVVSRSPNADTACSLCVHQEVAQAFLGACPDGFQVNHKNGIKTDNRIENLEYLSPSENTRHSLFVLKKRLGINNGSAKLTDELVLKARAQHASGDSINVIATELGITWWTCHNAIVGKTWKHVV